MAHKTGSILNFFYFNISGKLSKIRLLFQLLEELDDREDGDTRESWWTEIRQEVHR